MKTVPSTLRCHWTELDVKVNGTLICKGLELQSAQTVCVCLLSVKKVCTRLKFKLNLTALGLLLNWT